MRAPPKFATDAWAWEYTRRKLEDKHGVPYEEWQGKLFAAAGAIYKRVLAKYGPGNPVEGEIAVLVPREGALEFIAPGSGIVSGFMGEEVLIDYEGNTIGAELLDNYKRRVLWAAQRHRDRTHTSARALVATTDVRIVGYVNGTDGVTINNQAAIDAYLKIGVAA